MADQWSSRCGVILAVAGSAVGLGNFLRFPGLVAEFGGGAFIIAYALSFLLIGLPICWAEWTIGRTGGVAGFNSAPGIFASVTQNPKFRYLGVLAIVVPIGIYFYYLIIESWCLAYAVNYLTGGMDFKSAEDANNFFNTLTGVSANGSAIKFDLENVLLFVIASLIFNFYLIYKGISKGIEKFCSIAMPTLFIISIIILIRVLTLGTPDANFPENNVNNGLAYLWNPTFSELLNPSLWLAAASQIFFSLSVGFGVIITYASYMKSDDDVVLSGLTAASTNEFFEVAMGGMITIPAAIAFFGVTGLAQIGLSTFAVGFNVLPMVFTQMPLGSLFGFLFFFLLFLSAITSSLSMLQPALDFIKEILHFSHAKAVALLFLISTVGACFVLYGSADLKALDTLDYWITNLFMYVLATVQIIIFGWVVGIDKSMKLAHEGAKMKMPKIYRFIIKYLTPSLLLIIFINWIINIFIGDEINPFINDLFYEPNIIAWISVGLICTLTFSLTLAVKLSKNNNN
jgi:SNF family Na+-dependent transporter